MMRLRLIGGVAVVAMTTAGCGMGGDSGGGGGDADGGGGHLVYAEQFPPAAAWATGDQ